MNKHKINYSDKYLGLVYYRKFLDRFPHWRPAAGRHQAIYARKILKKATSYLGSGNLILSES